MIKLEFENKKFPEMLRKIKNPPKSLWVEGNVDLLNTISIAIIGSRKCSNYGEKWCKKFTKDLLEYNLTIVSGLAIGIDKTAHDTALKYGGKTIAVLPSGLKNIYPTENLNLYKNIINSGGAVVSEYMPEERCDKKKFLERNRIVSGLGIGTLVVEAGYRSGTSVTAKITKQNGKKDFCIPGSLDNSKSLGTNTMVKNGAILVTSVNDIICNYKNLKKTRIVQNIKKYEVSKEFQDIYELISEKPMEINLIAKLTDQNVSSVMAKITFLEIEGKIKRLGGNKIVAV